jgi:signal transduction histidine kinase
VERFDRRAGLPGLPPQLRQMPTAVEGTDGRLWFAVNNAVVWVDPKHASNRTPPPPVSVQSVSGDDKGYDLDRALIFPAGTSSVHIRYAAVSLLNPEAIRFRYRLANIDPDWQEAGATTSVTYRSLSPAEYRFEVGVTDANGSWSDRTAIARFTILPAFYQTRSFVAACGALLVALLWAAYRLRIAQLRRRFEMTLDARVGERTRIARDLHDTLLQSFQALLLHLQTVFLLLPDRVDEAKVRLGGVIDQAADAITQGRDAVQDLRESTTQRNDLALAIGLLGQELPKDADKQGSANLSITVHGEARDLHPIVRDEIYKVAAEALRNAFRHAQAARIEVDIRYDDDQFRLQVRDDGKGIEAALLREGVKGHYGLRGIEERARVIDAKLELRSDVGIGTDVILSVPASRAYAAKGRWAWRRSAETA